MKAAAGLVWFVGLVIVAFVVAALLFELFHSSTTQLGLGG
jgi:hypothetical protein